jgi:hypothetical protein
LVAAPALFTPPVLAQSYTATMASFEAFFQALPVVLMLGIVVVHFQSLGVALAIIGTTPVWIPGGLAVWSLVWLARRAGHAVFQGKGRVVLFGKEFSLTVRPVDGIPKVCSGCTYHDGLSRIHPLAPLKCVCCMLNHPEHISDGRTWSNRNYAAPPLFSQGPPMRPPVMAHPAAAAAAAAAATTASASAWQ